ncbi:MAG: glycosyltransferase family 25 protein [Betaproteobacteria bacterium]
MATATPWFDGFLIVNPRSYVERRRHVEAQLARFGLTGEFIHDWDAEDIDPATDARFFAGDELSRGQKSCTLKHVEALRRIAARGWSRALVLEDDVVLADDFVPAVAAGLAETAAVTEAHVLFIGSGGNFYTPRSAKRPGQRVYRASKGRFTDSYVIGAATAQRRLQWIDTHRMHKPTDVTFDAIDRELGIRLLWLEPPVVEQGSKNGLFTSVLEPQPPRSVQRLKFALEKLRRKYVYQLWR